METDYLTVNKDLHVKGDFIVDGLGFQAFDAIITGSLKVNGPTLGSVGSFTRVVGAAGSAFSYLRVTGLGSFGELAVQGSARFHGPTNLPSLTIFGAAPEFVSSFTGDTNGTFVNPLGVVADGSSVYIADNNRTRIQKRSKSNWSHQQTYSSAGWAPQ